MDKQQTDLSPEQVESQKQEAEAIEKLSKFLEANKITLSVTPLTIRQDSNNNLVVMPQLITVGVVKDPNPLEITDKDTEEVKEVKGMVTR